MRSLKDWKCCSQGERLLNACYVSVWSEVCSPWVTPPQPTVKWPSVTSHCKTCFSELLYPAAHSNNMRFLYIWQWFDWVMTVNSCFHILSLVLRLKKNASLLPQLERRQEIKGGKKVMCKIRETGGLWLWQMSLEGSGADNSDLISRLWHISDKLQWCYLSLLFDSLNQAHVP